MHYFLLLKIELLAHVYKGIKTLFTVIYIFGYVLQRLAVERVLVGTDKANGTDKLACATNSVGCTRHLRPKYF